MNPPTCFPGTKVPISKLELLNGIFTATNGIILSQVCEITGLEAGTVQNWIKRGYVNPPVGRKYSKAQAARIILINMLRETMVIEKVAKLLSYVNGNLLDYSDDIMDDSDIYQLLCDILIPLDANENVTSKLFTQIQEHLADFIEPYPGAKNRLELVLKAMACAWESARFKSLANQLTENI